MTEMTLTDVERAAQRDSELPRQIRRVNVGLLLLAAALIVGPAIHAWWLLQQYPSVSTVSLANLSIDGDAALCPGEPLVWSYDFHAEGAGVLVRDRTLWSITPPRTKIFSTREHFILEGPITQHLTETWHIPTTYRNPETDIIEPLPPGEYKRLLAISSPSRSTVVTIAGAEFTIREDCEQ